MDLRALVPEWIRTLTPYPPGKPIEELERELGIRDSIKLASNENPLGPSPKAVAAITAALADLHRYPDGSAFYLKRRLAERLGVSEAELIVGNGSNEIIELAVRTFLRPGDEAVMADQAFVVYRLVVQAAGGTSRMVPLRDFTHDLEAIAAAVTPRTRLVFLGNPNNPTGTIVRRAAWRAFLGRLPEHLLVVADDAYAEYVEDPEYPDTIRERGDGRVPVLSLRTFSKLYGLAGLRIGYGVAAAPVIDALDRIRQPFNVNALALAGARAALDDEEHVRRTLAANRAGMAFLTEAFRALGLAHVPSAANFVLVRVGDGARVYEALLRRGAIVLAAPVGTCAALAAAFRPHARAGALLTDVGSVKQILVAELEAAWAGVGPVVGAHPIAGSEASGAGAACADLFRGRRCILTPTPATDRAALARVRALWEGVGARVEEMPPAVHAARLARVSHLPHP